MGDQLETAIKLHQSGEIDAAERIYKKILRTDPNHDNALRLLALIENRKGRRKSAKKLIRKAISLNPGVPAYYNNLGEFLRSGKNFEEAIQNYAKAIELNPDYAEAYNNFGNALYQQGCEAEAIGKYEAALKINPRYPDALFNLGVAHAKRGNDEPALGCFERAVALQPTHKEAYLGAIAACRKLKRDAAAERLCRELLKVDPASSQAHVVLGEIKQAQGDFRHAAASIRHAIALDPENADAHVSLGKIQNTQGYFDAAVVSCRRAIELDPRSAAAYGGLGRAQAGSSLNEEAVASFAQAIALEPAASQPYIDMAASLLELGREGEAAAATARALEIAPLLPDTHLAAAHVAHTRGEIDAAIAACRRALEVAPDAARAYYLLSLWGGDFGRDGEIEAMDALYRADATAFEQKTLLAFALSNAFERLGDYGKAWAYLSEGNALKRRIWSEEVSGVADVAREVRSMDWHALAQTGRGQEKGSESAIFILGLSRSGKTLTETLLSRHPLIEAGGELASLARLVQERLIGGTGAHFPACLNGREHLPLREIGEAYLSALKLGERAGPYVVNTSPGNWPYVGLILACLPRAKIIVCRREARDNCFEIFKTAYAIRNTYSYDLDATGRYHGLYTAMMDYWAQLFPDSMYFVQFEQLIADPQAEVLGILDFLGIDRSAAPVQALFSGDALAAALPRPEAVTGRWRPYSEFLQPLFDALDECEGGNASRAHEPLLS